MDVPSHLLASGLWRPEARWPDKVIFAAAKIGALRAKAASRLGPAGQGWERLMCRVGVVLGEVYKSFVI